MKKLSLIFFSLLTSLCFAQQQTVTGTVKDADGALLPGVNIIEKGTNNGATTDFDGKYSIEVSPDATLIYSYVGFNNKELAVNSQSTINVMLSGGAELEEVLLVGSRAMPRSNTTSSLPIDVLPAKELSSTGQMSFDKAMQYRIPSFNTVQTPVNDATSLLDPYEIRNMGPSRTLILINGKRKNLSSLLYTQTSPGRGETGSDISAIPTDAIKRVEILRDGASAQYGSDAIAGVMNIVLKDNTDEGSVTLRTGMTVEGDGETIGISLNNGSSIGDDKGFVNYTVDLSKVSLANRPGTVDAAGEAADFGASLADVQAFLALKPDAGNINGSPETAAAKFSLNAGYDIDENTEVYMNGAYVYKKVNSFANYRTPYWRTETAYPYLADFFPNGANGEYIGYVPTFEGDLNDYNATLGFKAKKNGWNYDLSLTTGGNSQDYSVNNTHNGNSVFAPSFDDTNGNGVADPGEEFLPIELYRENSPISFNPGGTKFSHHVGNLDISKLLTEKISIGVGAEFRAETFEIVEGDLASYDGGGADSFGGNNPKNSGAWSRYNFGGYFDISADITDDILLNGTVRMEDYSDFGEAFVWKVSGRYKFLDDKITLRASMSTGFRAPTLHQIYTQKAQYSFVPGSGIQVGGLINNVSPEARLLKLDKLDAEKSENFTAGLGLKPIKNLNITIDYYNIAVEDRIVLSTEVTPPAGPSFEGLSDVSFFVNAIDTRTSGIDFVANYSTNIGSGKLGFALSGNYTLQNEREGDVKNPKFVSDAGQSVVNETQEALFFTSRPETKWILGINYDIGKLGFSLNNTFFGKTKFAQQGLQDLEKTYTDYNAANYDANGAPIAGTVAVGRGNIDGKSDLRTEFKPNIVTDLGINYNVTEKLTISANVNNILNILPEWEFVEVNSTGSNILNGSENVINSPSNLITFNQRYSQMTYDGYHFSQLGTMFNLSLNYKF